MKKLLTISVLTAFGSMAAMAQDLGLLDPVKEVSPNLMPVTFDLILGHGGLTNQTRTGTAWRNSDSLYGSKDARGNVTVFYQAVWDSVSNVWSPPEDIRQNLTYDGSGKVLTLSRRITDGTTTVTSDATYSYDGTGKRLPTISYDTVKSGTTTTGFMSVDSFVYNGSGKIVDRFMSKKVFGISQPSDRYVYTYDGSGRLATSTRKAYASSTWTDESRQTMTYDVSGNIITNFVEVWNDTIWSNNSIDSFYYTGGKQTGYRQYTWDVGTSAWEGNSWNNFVFTGNNVTEIYSKEWVSGAWVNSEKSTVTWDGTNMHPVEARYYKWLGTAYETTHSSRIIWGSGTVGISPAKDASAPFSIFPNPATTYITVSFGSATNANVSYNLVDLTGRSVLSQTEKVAGERMTLNNLDLSKGIYYMMIDCNGSTYRTKVVIE